MTKLQISINDIKKDLIIEGKGNLTLSFAILLGEIVCPLPILIGLIYCAVIIPKDTPLQRLFSIGFCIIAIFFFIICAIMSHEIIVPIIDYYLIKRNKYSIVIDDVSIMNDQDTVRGSRTTVCALYFYKYGKYVASRVLFDTTHRGDTFYVVILNKKKPTPYLVYATKKYDFIE